MAQTPLDFRTAKRVGDDIGGALLARTKGFDHNFVLVGARRTHESLAVAAQLADPLSGRSMRVATSEPGMQLYTSNYLTPQYIALCLETQHFPSCVVLEQGERRDEGCLR